MSHDCLDPETIAAFAEGKVERREIPAVLAHLDRCRDCRRALEAAAAEAREPRSGMGWLMAAAAVLAGVALLAIPAVRQSIWPSSPTERLIELAPRAARVVEPRLAGGFPWAPYRGPVRASNDKNDPDRLALVGEAGKLITAANRDGGAEDQRNAGVALLLIEEPDDAIKRLAAATERAPNDARGWNDLAAAQYAAAIRHARPSLYPEALASVDRALAADARFAEALFNRALILERLGLTQQARAAWETYLQADPSSEWAEEARTRLAKLPASSESSFKSDYPKLEAAVGRMEHRLVMAIVDRHRQQARAFAEVETLGRWAEATRRGDGSAAQGELATARAIGDALVTLSGESLLRRAVHAIENATEAQRAQLAEAHTIYRRGRITYSRQQPGAAEPDLRRAAELFAAGNSPMALVARYYAANTRFDQNDVAGARTALEALRTAAQAEPRYAALAGLVRWELMLCRIFDADWSGVAALGTEAAAAFRNLGEKENLGVIEIMLADSLVNLGRLDEGWAARIRAFEILSTDGKGNRLATAIGEAALMDTRAGRLAAAHALLRLEEASCRTAANDVLLSSTLVRMAMLEAKLGRPAAAAKAREALAIANRIADPELRARGIADAQFAEGAVVLTADPRRARALLTTAIEHYRAKEKALHLPEAELLRARAALRLGDRDAAARDLASGLATAERHRARLAGAVGGMGVIDTASALVQEGIALALARNDPAEAFAYAERAHRRVGLDHDINDAIDVAALQRRLQGTNAAVLSLAILPEEIVAFSVTARDFSVARTPAPEGTLSSLLAAGAADEAMRKLYDLLVRPSERALAGQQQLIVIADPLLANVPFAALHDGGGYLIERFAIALAPSAGALRVPAEAVVPRAVAAVALPSGTGNVALAESAPELTDVVSLYPAATKIDADRATVPALLDAAAAANVIHIAGHTERQPGPGDAALVFAGRGTTGTERVSWSNVATMALKQPSVVVLSACETLRAPQSAQARALSLGGGFLAAGATDVVGTLTTIADADAREIFRNVHRELARGAGAVTAVRRAQLELLAEETRTRRRTAWRGVAVITNRIPRGN